MNQIDIESLTSRRSSEVFPNFLVNNPNDTIPLIVPSLEMGDYQLIIDLNGNRKVIARISLSAYNVDRLIRCTGSLIYRQSSEVSHVLLNVEKYLEVV